MNKAKVIHKGKWLNFMEKETETGVWEYVEREGERSAVVIVARTDDNQLAVIEQVRVPLGRTIVEFPAGLIDDGETPEEAAVRELKEETGYTGVATSCSSPVTSSGGLTTEILYFVEVKITDIQGEQRLDDEEKIKAFLIDVGEDSLSDLEKYAKATGYLLSSRLYAYFMGRA